MSEIVIAAKCLPGERLFKDIAASGLQAVELYLREDILEDSASVISLCKKFPFRYALHAPNKGYQPRELAALASGIDAEVIVFHNNYWEDEWAGVFEAFKNLKTKVCVENIFCAHEPVKIMRRFHAFRCLDLEHLQLETNGVFEEIFLELMKEATHIHLTGYTAGSQMWHTPIHHSPEHNEYILNLIKKSGYKGLVVSEAKVSFQNPTEFKALNEFFQKWKNR